MAQLVEEEFQGRIWHGDQARYTDARWEGYLLMGPIGKTAPRLIEDLLNYDPRLEDVLRRNILTSPPSANDLYSNVASIIPSDNCRHDFVWKQSQESQLPAEDSRPEYGSIYRLSAICQYCRQHLDLRISWTDYQASRTQAFASCPTKARPLHHFQFIKEATQPRRHGVSEPYVGVDRSFLFRCSSDSCQASLDISLRQPVFQDTSVDLLTNPERLRQRFEKAKKTDSSRNDFQVARPAAALDALATYLKDGMKIDNTRRQIPLRNKRYMVTFGEDCEDLLTSLGFTINDASEDGFCHLPQPQDQPDPAGFIEYLEDVREELIILLHQQPDKEKHGARSILDVPRSVLGDIRRCLSCQGYATNSRSRTTLTVDFTAKTNAFAGLGALPDFADPLIIFAFERQRDCNPADTAYYIDCLSEVFEQRPQSEALGTELAILKSAGQHGSKEIEAAFAYFNLSRQQSHVYDEDHIIGLFNSRIADSGPSTHAEAREALRMIGESLNSQKIRDTASTVLETYEQALQYLELDRTSQEDAVQAMFGVKVAENQELAERALQIVADNRDSTYLKELLHQSQAGAPAMDLAEAFRILGVEDRSTFDSSMLDILLATRIEEAPSREKDFARAAEVIRSSGDSSIVNNAKNSFSMPSRPPGEWPVGLQNLGNTCYLNSLLQYYFTIRPFRDLLLNLSQHKQDAQTLATSKKKVGGMEITKEQLERCQELAEQLGDLFKDMITAPSSSVRPTLKLASDALNKVDKQMEASLRRRSTIGGNRPFTLGQIDGAPVQGPSLPSGSSSDGASLQTVDKLIEPEIPAAEGDSASDITLVGDDPTPPSSDEDTMADEEWEQVEDIAKPEPTDVSMSDTAVDDEQHDSQTGSKAEGKAASDIYNIPDDGPTPPDRPPPVPPRNKSAGIQLSQVEEAAKQQDVNEVIGNVLFQTEVAIRPDGIFEDTGEQDDIIKKTFFGKIKFNYGAVDQQPKTDDSTEVRPEWPINLARKPADLMEALDHIFDLEHVDLGGRKIPRYVTIETLPPVLQIFIPRIGWDDEKKTTFKLETPLLLQERIFMDQFMDGKPQLIEKRRKRWKWKKELRVLEARRAQLARTTIADANVAEVLEGTSELLEKIASDKTFHGELMDEDLDADSSLVLDMRKRATEIKEDLRALDQRIWGLKESIKDEFDDPGYQQLAYRLHAIFIHRGSAGFGHYWVYIRDFQRNKWLKYNDEYVSEEDEFDVAKICAADGTPAATPYFCVYVKEGMEDELVESLHRLPAEDVEMAGATQVIEGIEVQV